MHISKWMDENGLTDNDVAKSLGCSISAISKLRTKYGRPSLERAYEIEKLSVGQVALRDWIYRPSNRAHEQKRWLAKKRKAR